MFLPEYLKYLYNVFLAFQVILNCMTPKFGVLVYVNVYKYDSKFYFTFKLYLKTAGLIKNLEVF